MEMRMKALVLESEQTLSLIDVVPPSPAEGESLITVEATGIGGSEYLGFANPGIRSLPNTMSHG